MSNVLVKGHRKKTEVYFHIHAALGIYFGFYFSFFICQNIILIAFTIEYFVSSISDKA